MTTHLLRRTTTATTALLGTAAVAWGTPPTSAPAGVYGLGLPPDRILPPSLSADPAADVATGGGASRAFALSPQVQAIPTPTGFQAGAAVLAVVALVRLGRRLRRRVAG